MAISSTTVTVTAVPDPLITPRAELAPRQTSSGDDPALLGWVDATNGQFVVPTVGASGGVSYLGCWATSLGQEPFTLIRDIGDVDVAPSSSTVSSEDSTASASPDSTTASGSTSETLTNGAESSTSATPTTGAAAVAMSGSFAGMIGLLAMLFSMI
ncbi:hypothetical protein AA0118_g8201 [Alternaria tenuissima]|nr:hypothetical protein AA0118_g8201 [Alternaria tenuissima]